MQRRRNGTSLPAGVRLLMPSFPSAENGEIHGRPDGVETRTIASDREKNFGLAERQNAPRKINLCGTMHSRRRSSVTSVMGARVQMRKNSFNLANFANRTHNFLQDDTESHLAAVLGSPGVGKTALIVRYITGRFVHEYDPTLEMTYEKLQEVGDVKGMLRIMDTAGSIESCMSYIRRAEGIIVVYSITDRYSFEAAKDYLRMIKEYTSLSSPFDYDLPIILVGNKRELRRGREVMQDEARLVAREYGSLFVESSAACDRNVEKIFTNLFLQIHRIKEERQRMISSNTRGFVNSVRNFFHSKRK